MRKTIKYIILIALLFMLSACGENSPASPVEKPEAKKISAEEAHNVITSENDYFLLDVRTEEEFNTIHIDGAVLIPDTELIERASELPQDMGKTILVYCRSGRRSALSAQQLAEMGYTDVRDFGGIIDWPFETVKGEIPVTAAEETAEHEHNWQDFDCNNKQCTICGTLIRYTE